MDWIPFQTAQIQWFLLVVVRIASILVLSPIFSSTSIPPQLKFGLALVLAIIVFPFIPTAFKSLTQPSMIVFCIMVIKEIMIGCVIGFAASLLFAAIQFAGSLLDLEIGFTLVEVFDPFTESAMTVSAQFQLLLFSVLFLVSNSHYFLLLAIQRSLELIPIGQGVIGSALTLSTLTTMVGALFGIAVRLAAPIYVVLFLSSIALGVVARTVPQLNIFFVGLPLKIVLGLGVMAFVLPALAHIFYRLVDTLMKDIWKLLFSMV